MTIFNNPFKRNDTAVIVGFAKTSRDMAPYDAEDRDFFLLNECYTWLPQIPKHTQWFQIHPMFDFMRKNNRNDPAHYAWLRSDHEFPIWMQGDLREVPNSQRYPIEDALRTFNNYLTSSVSYMVALAVMSGYQRIELFGVEMAADSEYGYQKAGLEFILGYAKGAGIDVWLPENCSLLRANLYAYEDLRAADRTWLSEIERGLKTAVEESQVGFQQTLGRLMELREITEDKGFPQMPDSVKRWLIGRMLARQEDQGTAQTNFAEQKGKLAMARLYIAWHDSQNIPADRDNTIFLPKEGPDESA